MKKKLQHYLLLLMGVAYFSCSQNGEDPDGIWDDNIKLSAKTATLSAAEDSVIFFTEGT